MYTLNVHIFHIVDNTAAQSETDIKISDGARDGTAMYDHGIRDVENLLPEKGEERAEERPSNNACSEKQPHGFDNEGLIWKTAVVVIIWLAWVLWGQDENCEDRLIS